MHILTPSGKQLGVHKLVAMSTMLSPTHGQHLKLSSPGDGSSTTKQQLFLSHTVQDHLRRVFDRISNCQPTIMHAQLVTWLVNVQHQEVEGSGKQEYRFEGFLEALYYSFALEATERVALKDKDLTKPISHYFISSSHNTYLMGNQLSSKSSTEAYTKVLLAGCRCIEIDVHDGDTIDSSSDEESQISKASSQTSSSKRHFSASTIAHGMLSAKEKMDDAMESAKRKVERSPFGKYISPEGSKTSLSLSPEGSGDPVKRPSSAHEMLNGEPLVLHGWTLTAPVGFRSVCKAIRDTAFVNSPLPIIVSLEVHACVEQQEMMVKIMKEEWQGLLVDQPYIDCDPAQRLPRLEELMNKILVKVKKATAPKMSPAKIERMRTFPVTKSGSLAPSSIGPSESAHSGSEEEKGSGSGSKKTPKKVVISEVLSKLGIYTHSERFDDFSTAASGSPSHIFSVGENRITELHQTKRAVLFDHNRRFFMRAYPAGIRFDSSNLDPSIFWRKGVQMVALNWQHLDEAMMLNEGMFADEFGWVLKPPGYRDDVQEPIRYQTLDLCITVFAGQHLPLPTDDVSLKSFHPFVKCELHIEAKEERTGEPIEGGGTKLGGGQYKRKTEPRRGDQPDWGPDGARLDFEGIPQVVDSLSFVRFKIEDQGLATTDLAAWACIRLDRLQRGYRFVSLFDAKGLPTNGILLVKVEKVMR